MIKLIGILAERHLQCRSGGLNRGRSFFPIVYKFLKNLGVQASVG